MTTKNGVGSGKSTIAIALERELHKRGLLCRILDGDNIRTGINNNLGFSETDRVEKLADAAIQMTTKNGVGSTPNWTESDRANGKANAAAALFVISSVNKLVIINKTASNTCGP